MLLNFSVQGSFDTSDQFEFSAKKSVEAVFMSTGPIVSRDKRAPAQARAQARAYRGQASD